MNKLPETVASSSKARDTLMKRTGKGSRICPEQRAVPGKVPAVGVLVKVSDYLGQEQDSDTAGDGVAESTGHLSICMTDTQLAEDKLSTLQFVYEYIFPTSWSHGRIEFQDRKSLRILKYQEAETLKLTSILVYCISF